MKVSHGCFSGRRKAMAPRKPTKKLRKATPLKNIKPLRKAGEKPLE
jgi:hypothetical protein